MGLIEITEESCVCPICKVGYMAITNWEDGFFRKRCHLCASTISNFDFLGGNKFEAPKVHIGYGSLHLAKRNEHSEGFFQFNQIYDLDNFLKKWGYLFTDLKWRNTFDESNSYAYVFNPQTKTGELIWGKGVLDTYETVILKQ